MKMGQHMAQFSGGNVGRFQTVERTGAVPKSRSLPSPASGALFVGALQRRHRSSGIQTGADQEHGWRKSESSAGL